MSGRHVANMLATFSTKSLLKRAGSTVVEYFDWDLLKVLSQGIAELLKDADNRRFSSEPDVVESNSDADS